jgi:hypothetical protein
MTDARHEWGAIVRSARAHFEGAGARLDLAVYAAGVADALMATSPDLAGRMVTELTGLAHEPQEWWRDRLRKLLIVELLRRPSDGKAYEPTSDAIEILDRLVGDDEDLRAVIAEEWADEADRRVEEIRRGAAKLIPGEQVFREAMEWLEADEEQNLPEVRLRGWDDGRIVVQDGPWTGYCVTHDPELMAKLEVVAREHLSQIELPPRPEVAGSAYWPGPPEGYDEEE